MNHDHDHDHDHETFVQENRWCLEGAIVESFTSRAVSRQYLPGYEHQYTYTVQLLDFSRWRHHWLKMSIAQRLIFFQTALLLLVGPSYIPITKQSQGVFP